MATVIIDRSRTGEPGPRPDHAERGLLHVVEVVGRELGRGELAAGARARRGPQLTLDLLARARSSSLVAIVSPSFRAGSRCRCCRRRRGARARTRAPSTWRPVASPRSWSTRFVDLREAGRATRVAARDEPAVGVERDAPAGTGLAFLDELVALALGAEAEQLVVLELLVHERVVTERDADVLGSEPGGLVTLDARCRASSSTDRRPGRRTCGHARSVSDCSADASGRTTRAARLARSARDPRERGSRTPRRRRPGSTSWW